MMMTVYKTVQFGELVVAAFDEAAQHSSDPREVSRLATRALKHTLRRARKTSRSTRRLRRLLVEAPHEDPSDP
jgi:phage shock protein A